MPQLGRRAARPRIDVAGALALTAAVVPLLLALSLGHGVTGGAGADGHPAVSGGGHWGSPLVLGLFGLSVVAGAAFVARERRAPEPILDLRLFRIPVFAWGNAAIFVMGAAFFSGIVFLPLFMVNVVGLSATRSGATLTPLTLAVVAGNVVSGQLVTRIGKYRPLMIGALIILIIAFLDLALELSPSSTQTGVTLRMILVGLGLGPSIPLYTLAVQNGVSPDRIGVATATATFFRQMGATIGVALQGTIFAVALAHEMLGRPGGGALAVKEAFSAATRWVYLVSAGVALVALLLTLRLPGLPLRKSNR
jgi:predicted MFS family arabinose efflux permease